MKNINVIDIKSYPGLYEQIGEPDSILKLKTFLDTPGIKNSFVARDLKNYKPLSNALLSPSWSSLASKLGDKLNSYRFEIIEEEEVWLPLKVYSLYCPPIKGAKATLTIGSEKGSKESFRFELFGLGGGPEFEFNINVSDSISSNGENISVFYNILTIWERCIIENKTNKQVMFPRMKKVISNCQQIIVKNDIVNFDLFDQNKLLVSDEFDLTNTQSSLSRKYDISKGTKWDASTEINVHGFKIGPKYSATIKTSNSYEFELMPGYKHHIFQPQHFPCFYWEIINK